MVTRDFDYVDLVAHGVQTIWEMCGYNWNNLESIKNNRELFFKCAEWDTSEYPLMFENIFEDVYNICAHSKLWDEMGLKSNYVDFMFSYKDNKNK